MPNAIVKRRPIEVSMETMEMGLGSSRTGVRVETLEDETVDEK